MKSKYLMIGAAVCAALFLFSGIMLCRQYADEKQSTEAFEQVAALVETESAPADTPQETEPLSELAAFEKYRAVQEQNSDFVGWLSMESQVAYKLLFTEYPDVVNVEQMCEMLGGICDKTAYRLLKSGEIKSFIVGRHYRIPKLNILEYLELIDKSNA